MATRMECRACRWWTRDPAFRPDSEATGECHRYPPSKVANPDAEGWWAKTRPDSFCAEWTAGATVERYGDLIHAAAPAAEPAAPTTPYPTDAEIRAAAPANLPQPSRAARDVAEWTVEQEWGAKSIAWRVRLWHDVADGPSFEGREQAAFWRVCAEIAKHAHLFVPPTTALDVPVLAIVRMPDSKPENGDWHQGYSDGLSRGWNACLEAVRKLNPGVSFVGAGEEQSLDAAIRAQPEYVPREEAARSGQDGTDEELAEALWIAWLGGNDGAEWDDMPADTHRDWLAAARRARSLLRTSSDAELAGMREAVTKYLDREGLSYAAEEIRSWPLREKVVG